MGREIGWLKADKAASKMNSSPLVVRRRFSLPYLNCFARTNLRDWRESQ